MSDTVATALQLVNYELTQVGYEAGPDDQNKYSSWLGKGPEAWCADFQGYCSKHVTGDPLGPYYDPYTPTFAQHFRDHNRFIVDQAQIVTGDVVFFDRIGAGRISHVGLAVNQHGTVEGNTPIGETYFGVGRHSLPDPTYRGHGRPAYAASTGDPVVPPSAPDPVKFDAYQHVPIGSRMIVIGDQGDDVQALQWYLNQWYPHLPQLVPDGQDGPLTTARVKYLQKRAGIQVDGKVGPQTYAVLHVRVRY